MVLSAYWQFVERQPLVLGTSTKLEYAKESWNKAVKLIEKAQQLDNMHPKVWTRQANGEQESWTNEECRYKIAASNAQGGRSLTINKLILDELREHHSYSAWDASVPAGNAVSDFQAWCMSNAGDDRSIVLNDLRDSAIDFINTGEGDDELCLMEWSSDEDADPTDLKALAQANPNLGHRIKAKSLLADARRAMRKGGEALTGFKTEYMCIRVKLLNPAIDHGAWLRCMDMGTMDNLRSRIAVCVDLSPDQTHASLIAAALMNDDRVRVDSVKDWSGPDCVNQMRSDLKATLRSVKPQTLGWVPNGPAAALAADLRRLQVPGMKVEEIRGDVAAMCMGLAEQVVGGRIAHSGDPLINDHIGSAERLKRGDTWVFARSQDGYVDAAYATAGAVHLARTVPSYGKPRLITYNGNDNS